MKTNLEAWIILEQSRLKKNGLKHRPDQLKSLAETAEPVQAGAVQIDQNTLQQNDVELKRNTDHLRALQIRSEHSRSA
ncbi:hypothetical protein F511_39346 [Dorcoceras hygrometricum]|uniref:Uncharacterized protein n=1 Tax=Dorcoceras hygrometricum TaxID=472368 RepID=A0A2Z7B431_9LAMI|nr:hypothetical protein F511_39346 [Dorcoceras hygrometricum]